MFQHVAASRGYEDCVLVLLKHGCNIHIRGKHIILKNRYVLCSTDMF